MSALVAAIPITLSALAMGAGLVIFVAGVNHQFAIRERR